MKNQSLSFVILGLIRFLKNINKVILDISLLLNIS